MTNEVLADNEGNDRPDVGRRQLNVGLLAALAGGLGMATTAQAFPRGAHGQFNAASRILAPYGVTVSGDDASGHDNLRFEIAALPTTEYTQVVRARNRQGALEPHWMTSVLGNDATATHFHPGEIIPCIRTTIEQDKLATHELFDSDQADPRDIVPCFTVESVMLEGGHFGTITATHFHDGAIVPCVRTTIEGHSLATHEVFDATGDKAVRRVTVATVMGDKGVLGPVTITLDPALERSGVTVVVCGNTYTLAGGELVPGKLPPA